MRLDRIAHRLQSVLGVAGDRPLAIAHPEVVKDTARSRVVRCRVRSVAPAPSSIVIRFIKAEPTRGFTDWASLAFLSSLPDARGLTPGFVVGDPRGRWFAVEDLGPGESLHDILVRGDPGEARRASIALTTSMTRLHTATVARHEAYETARRALPDAQGLGRDQEAETWLGGYAKIVTWFAALGHTPPTDLHACMTRIAEVYRDPDGFLCFTHGDPAPTNNHVTPGGTRLLDFEYGGYRHALYDITAWNVLCPLPVTWVREMRQLFREELAAVLPAARDEARFAEAWAYLCAYRALAILTWIPPDILDANRPWADGWTMREAVLVAMSRLREATDPVSSLRPVSEAAFALDTALRSRWPEHGDADESLPRWTRRPSR